MKVAALVLGPAGVGLVGLYTNLVSTAGSIASVGVAKAGVLQVVKSEGEDGEFATGRTRRALFWGSLVLATLGGTLFWSSSGWIARSILSDEARSGDVEWLSLGVSLTVLAAAQSALLTGLRRIGDFVRVNVAAGLVGAIVSVVALWLWPAASLVVVALTAPVFSFLFGRFYIARLGMPVGPRLRLAEMASEWRSMAQPGVALMLASVVALLGQLAARALVQRVLGPDALGHFQAAWSISVTYLGFVLAALGTDFFPRLTASISDRDSATKLINEQTEIGLLLCAPVILGMIAFAPWVIELLYSSDFRPAVEVLRWQLLADVLKVVSWPLGFMLLAKGAARTFLAVETLGAVLLVLGIFIGLPILGVAATGVSYLVGFVIYVPIVSWLGRYYIQFKWSRSVRVQAVGFFATAILVDALCIRSNVLGAAIGGALAALAALWALIRLSSLVDAGGRLGRISKLGKWITQLLKPAI